MVLLAGGHHGLWSPPACGPPWPVVSLGLWSPPQPIVPQPEVLLVCGSPQPVVLLACGHCQPVVCHSSLSGLIQCLIHTSPISLPSFTHAAPLAGLEIWFLIGHPQQEEQERLPAARPAHDHCVSLYFPWYCLKSLLCGQLWFLSAQHALPIFRSALIFFWKLLISACGLGVKNHTHS